MIPMRIEFYYQPELATVTDHVETGHNLKDQDEIRHDFTNQIRLFHGYRECLVHDGKQIVRFQHLSH